MSLIKAPPLVEKGLSQALLSVESNRLVCHWSAFLSADLCAFEMQKKSNISLAILTLVRHTYYTKIVFFHSSFKYPLIDSKAKCKIDRFVVVTFIRQSGQV